MFWWPLLNIGSNLGYSRVLGNNYKVASICDANTESPENVVKTRSEYDYLVIEIELGSQQMASHFSL